MTAERVDERPLEPGTVVRGLGENGKPTSDYFMVVEATKTGLVCIPVSWGSDGDDVLFRVVLESVDPSQVVVQPDQSIAGGDKPNSQEIASVLQVAASLRNQPTAERSS